MQPKVLWLFAFVLLYWSYCIFWGIKGMRASKTATDYFLAGRGLSMWVFVLAATATSFSGWTFMGHPGLIFRDGFQYAFASFYAITIPLTGVILLKRQWILGKHFGYVTPGEMLSDYYQGDGIRILTVLVALLFSVPYLGVQLAASGFLFEVLSDGLVPHTVGTWVLSLVVLIYVASGGLKAVAYVDTMQCILLALGIAATGFIALHLLGGWEGLTQGLAALAASDVSKWGTTQGHGGGDFNSYFAMPGPIQATAGLGVETPVGGLWTGTMMLTYMFALMGIQAAPAFTMWAFGNKSPKPFAPQQVWASSLVIGGIMIVFTAIQGIGANLLGANPEVNAAGLALSNVLPESIAAKPDSLVPYYFEQIADAFPWLVGLLAVCALAAMQSTGAAYMSTAGGMLTRDLYKHFLNREADHRTQKFFGRIGVLVIVISALLVATFSSDALVLLGGLAVAFGAQMWPALAGVCWIPWFTRPGVTWGLAAGLCAVILTETIGRTLFGDLLPWGRWPLTLHSAGWGILINLAVCVVVSALTQHTRDAAHHNVYHHLLRDYAALPEKKRKLKPVAWAMVIGWFLLAFGPGAVIGNTVFGNPNEPSTWMFGIPSIWAWQILFWLLGVGMMWFLAYKMELSTMADDHVLVAVDDTGDPIPHPGPHPPMPEPERG
ncbi:MAG: sodium:solute symporter family protein [Nitrospirota bacterium]|nr:sodium:solute symporter family protein [Nitrospirota bacterium]